VTKQLHQNDASYHPVSNGSSRAEASGVTDRVNRLVRQEASATSAYVAQYIIKRIKTFDPTPQRPFVLGLPTGSSPVGVYQNLVAAHQAGAISFKVKFAPRYDDMYGLVDGIRDLTSIDDRMSSHSIWMSTWG